MQFENDFEVASPIETVWDTLLNVEEVAPCMPGAEVLEQTGDSSYKVAIKVRLGPVSMQYRGDVEIVDPDPSAHQAKMVAKATEARGQGTANAEIGMRLEEQDGKTRAVLTTDLRLSGRAAAMGQGIVKDVAGKLTETFAECLATKLEGAPSGNGGAAAETGAARSPSSGATRVSETTAPAPVSSEGGEEQRDVSGVLEPEDVEAATSGVTTPEDSGEAPTTKETEQPLASRATPEVAAELPALEIAASVVSDRLRKPGVLAGAVAAVFVVGFAIGRLGR
jgi:uncharacterized protein